MSERRRNHVCGCDRRAMLRGLGATGLTLALGAGCSTVEGEAAPGPDRGIIADIMQAGQEMAVAAPDAGPSGGPTGLPPIDLSAPKSTQTATFALG